MSTKQPYLKPSSLGPDQAIVISAPGGGIQFYRFGCEEIWTAAVDAGSEPNHSMGMLIFETDEEADALFERWRNKIGIGGITIQYWL